MNLCSSVVLFRVGTVYGDQKHAFLAGPCDPLVEDVQAVLSEQASHERGGVPPREEQTN